jgi:hypothetical protein
MQPDRNHSYYDSDRVGLVQTSITSGNSLLTLRWIVLGFNPTIEHSVYRVNHLVPCVRGSRAAGNCYGHLG